MDFDSAFTERTPRIVNAAKLHRAANRKKAKQFLIEGENAVDAAVSTGAAVDVFVTEKAAERFGDIITACGYMGCTYIPLPIKRLSIYLIPPPPRGFSRYASQCYGPRAKSLTASQVWSLFPCSLRSRAMQAH